MPEVAEQVLARGDADMISMARPLLADPDWVRKAASGRARRDQHLHRLQPGLPRPRVRESQRQLPGQSARLRRDRVDLPPGDAGASASPSSAPARPAWPARRSAAERGHPVTLFDAATEIGGQFNLARRIPGKEEFSETLRYFGAQLQRHGVEQRLGASVDADELLARGFDEIVLATGIRPRRVDFPAPTTRRSAATWTCITGKAAVGASAALIGAGGIGFDVAEFLVQHPPSPTMDRERWFAEWGVREDFEGPGGLAKPRVEPAPRKLWLLQRSAGKPGARLGKTTGWIHRSTLKAKGVMALGGVEYLGVDDTGLRIRVAGTEQLLPVDRVVVCAGQEPLRALLAPLVAAGRSAHLIGGADVAAELDAKRAISQGSRLAAAF